MKTITRAQREKIYQKFQQNPSGAENYRKFRKSFHCYSYMNDMVGGDWCGMFLGIEKDGHSHT